MELYEWMVKPTPQREWIDRRGILLWLAFFFIELGAGTFFVSSFFSGLPNMLVAMLIGWLICGILGGGTHFLYLGHPFRLWRMVLRPNASWISRGLIFVGLFLFFGLVHMVLARWTSSSIALLIVTDILALLVIIYGGFAMNYINGIRLWNTALLPILYGVGGVWGGAGITLGTALATGTTIVGVTIEEWIRILLISYIVLLAVYLTSIGYGSVTGQYSVREILVGKWWPVMWLVVVVLGLALPIGVVATSYAIGLGKMPAAVLYLSIFCELIGDMAMRYLILKCGFYSPLVPSSNYATS